MRIITQLRCAVTQWLLQQNFQKRYYLANIVCPSTQALVRDARRRFTPIPLPRVSHVFYHHAAVELDCAENSLRTLLWNIPETDEVVLYDKGGVLSPAHFDLLKNYTWRSWAVHREVSPEMAAYTYGMNHSLPMARGDIICVWRSDYVYPRGFYEHYLQHINDHDIVIPYSGYIGGAHVNAIFVREHWAKLENYDDTFWRANAESAYSFYTSEDPVHFAIRRRVWEKLGGLNHQLWGYGWQFADFAARIRLTVPRLRVKYFAHDPPVHQNHASSLMVRSSNYDDKKQQEDVVGRHRFAEYLGGRNQFECYMYRWNQKLRPLPKEDLE